MPKTAEKQLSYISNWKKVNKEHYNEYMRLLMNKRNKDKRDKKNADELRLKLEKEFEELKEHQAAET